MYSALEMRIFCSSRFARYTQCYVTWYPLTTGIVVSQCPSSRHRWGCWNFSHNSDGLKKVKIQLSENTRTKLLRYSNRDGKGVGCSTWWVYEGAPLWYSQCGNNIFLWRTQSWNVWRIRATTSRVNVGWLVGIYGPALFGMSGEVNSSS